MCCRECGCLQCISSGLLVDSFIELRFDVFKEAQVSIEHAAEWVRVDCGHGPRHFHDLVHLTQRLLRLAHLGVLHLMLLILLLNYLGVFNELLSPLQFQLLEFCLLFQLHGCVSPENVSLHLRQAQDRLLLLEVYSPVDVLEILVCQLVL